MRGFLITPAKREILMIDLEDAGKIREILGRVECGHPLPGWICAVELEGSRHSTHTIDGHMCAGRTILYPSIEMPGEEYTLEQIKEMVAWL